MPAKSKSTEANGSKAKPNEENVAGICTGRPQRSAKTTAIQKLSTNRTSCKVRKPLGVVAGNSTLSGRPQRSAKTEAIQKLSKGFQRRKATIQVVATFGNGEADPRWMPHRNPMSNNSNLKTMEPRYEFFNSPVTLRFIEVAKDIPANQLCVKWYELLMAFIDKDKFDNLPKGLRDIVEMSNMPDIEGMKVGPHFYVMNAIHLASKAICRTLCPDEFMDEEYQFVVLIECLFLTMYHFNPTDMLKNITAAGYLIEYFTDVHHPAFKALVCDYDLLEANMVTLSPREYWLKTKSLADALMVNPTSAEFTRLMLDDEYGMTDALSRVTRGFAFIVNNIPNHDKSAIWCAFLAFTNFD